MPEHRNQLEHKKKSENGVITGPVERALGVPDQSANNGPANRSVDPHAPNQVKPSKTALREILIAVRQVMTPTERTAADAAITTTVMHWWRAFRPAVLGVYLPIRSEPDLTILYEALLACGAQLALPVVVGDAQPLKFLRWAPGETVQMGRHGVMVPLKQEMVEPVALLIPCVGFNAARMRLGYGGGFYDRTLAQTPHPMSLGIAYDRTEVQFEAQSHDIALDMIVTESRQLSASAE